MIALAHPLAAGNAVRLILAPPRGAATWTVARRLGTDPTGPADGQARIIAQASRDISILDRDGLQNGQSYHYRSFYFTAAGAPIAPAPGAAVVPASTFEDASTDALEVLRERVALGLAAEVAAGRLAHQHGAIPLLGAPFARPGEVAFPAVSVHLDSDEPDGRALGEMTASDVIGADLTEEFEGYLSRVQIGVTGIALTARERSDLRRALKRVVLANQSILAEAGLLQVAFGQTDTEILPPVENAALLFVTNGRFTCLAPSAVALPVEQVSDVSATSLENP